MITWSTNAAAKPVRSIARGVLLAKGQKETLEQELRFSVQDFEPKGSLRKVSSSSLKGICVPRCNNTMRDARNCKI